jgi:hypothetical protein
MSEDSYKKWRDAFEENEKARKLYRDFIRRQARFVDDLIERMAELTSQHFTAALPHSDWEIPKAGDKYELWRAFRPMGISPVTACGYLKK